MDRKGIFAVVLSITVLLIWQIKFAPKFLPPTPPPGAEASPSASASPGASIAPGQPTPVISSVATSSSTSEPKVAEEMSIAQGLHANYHFTNLGGAISYVDLTAYPAASGSDVDLSQSGKLAIGALSEQPGEGANLPYKVTVEGNTVTCTRDVPGGLSIVKKFTLPSSDSDAHGYRIKLDISFTNHGAAVAQDPGYYLYLGSAVPIHTNDQATYTAFDWDAQGKSDHADTNTFLARKIPLVGVELAPERAVYTADADQIGWGSISSQYFTTVLNLKNGLVGKGAWARRFPVDIEGKSMFGIEGGLRLPPFSLAAGQTVTQSFDIYSGPKFYSTLKSLGGGQERIISYYFSFWGMTFFRPVSVFLLNSLNTIHQWTHNYAISIILLTLCIRGLLWPIQNKATSSMRQMQEVQPRMAELKEKYKDDPAKMNTEVMRLYKEYNINPLAGCLPMFIQMPIFFGFYRVLGTATELRNSTFLWVHDLSQPDTVFHLLGAPVNILPLCMAATMLVQMSMSPKSGDQSQQRIMMFVPLIFIFICYNFASALALYMTVQNIFSIMQLYVTRRRTSPAPLKKVAKRKSR